MAITKVTSKVLEAAQPNITSVGTLTGLDINGNLEIGSIETTTNFPLIVKSGTNDHAIAIEEASGGETWQLGVNVNGDLGFYNSGATTSSVSFIDGAGQVLIGEDTGDAFNADAMLRLQRAGDRVFQSFKVDADQEASIFFGDVDDDIECGITYEAANQSLSFSTGNNAEAMRIDSSGNVGIGTTSPNVNHKLTIVDTTGNGGGTLGLNVSSSGTSDNLGRLHFGNATDPVLAAIFGIADGASDAGALTFRTEKTGEALEERMRIDSSGNLLVGKTSDSNTSNGVTARPDGGARFTSAGTSSFVQLAFFRNGSPSEVGSITTTSSATAYNTSSDYRLKENVDYDFTALDRVKQLKPARFNFITDADTTVDGFIAHEVQDIVPEAITGEKDAVKEEEYEITPAVLDDDGNVVTEAEIGTREVPDYQGIDQSKLVPLLTKAIQEQQTIIDDLKTRIETLENA